MVDPFEALLGKDDPTGAVERALVRWMAREFDEQWNACLDAIGTPPEQKTPLAMVFVDLAESEARARRPARRLPQGPAAARRARQAPRPRAGGEDDPPAADGRAGRRGAR